MSRIRIDLPDTFSFSTTLAVRITDLNYGGHLGNDAVLSLLHEARMRFLQSRGLAELSFAGAGLIMSDAAIEFRSEAFFGDRLTAHVTATHFTRVGFDLFYKLLKDDGTPVALAKTGMICYDYAAKKVVSVPRAASEALTS
ncbi:MAG: thioesterase [Flaviaesturariibacter sp.]|nr:thioesterase [Flaviaesturariibacter sp.]